MTETLVSCQLVRELGFRDPLVELVRRYKF